MASGWEAYNARPLEKALIEVTSARFPPVGAIPDDLGTLNYAYVKAMRRVFEEFGDDIDMAPLFVDAVICVRPRQLWDLDTGKPTGPDIIEAMNVLEASLASQDGYDYPAFYYLYIYIMEMALNPKKAIFAADRLR